MIFDSTDLVASLLQSPTGQHHRPGLRTPLASSTGSHYWSALLAGIIGQDSWQHFPNTSMMITLMMMMMLIMIIMTTMMMMMMMVMVMVMVMMDRQYIRACACMSVHAPQ
jgi:hypothetical protein